MILLTCDDFLFIVFFFGLLTIFFFVFFVLHVDKVLK